MLNRKLARQMSAISRDLGGYDPKSHDSQAADEKWRAVLARDGREQSFSVEEIEREVAQEK